MHRWCLLNLTVQGFSLNLTVRGVSNKHCLLTFFIVACCIFSKLTIRNNSFTNTIRVPNSLDPDQAIHFVGPDLCPKLVLNDKIHS